MIRGLRDTESVCKTEAALANTGIGSNALYGQTEKCADVKRKQRIEITEVENGFAVTLTTANFYTEPKVFIAVNLQEATDLIMRNAR